MSTAAIASAVEDLVLTITEEMEVRASLEDTFDSILEQLGPGAQTPDGQPMNLTIEPWAGGRWFRDLGNGDGHFWGNVQAIKRPTLVEFCGPLFMSYAVNNNVQYRLSQTKNGTLIVFHHFACGAIPADIRQNVRKGWAGLAERIRKDAESRRSR
jgi:hypothetical protein